MVGFTINFTNVTVVADEISHFELNENVYRLDVYLKNGKELSFPHKNLDEARAAFNSLKAGMAFAGYDGHMVG
ncbi:KTSC domain-containing protein [Stenotrophomonas lactitubi]